MAEMRDEIGVEDNVGVVLRSEDGGIKHAEGVNGPDPEVWGSDEERPDPFAGEPDPGIPVGVVRYDYFEDDSVEDLRQRAKDAGITGVSKAARNDVLAALHEAQIGVTKGPGRQWETNEKGEYVNR